MKTNKCLQPKALVTIAPLAALFLFFITFISLETQAEDAPESISLTPPDSSDLTLPYPQETEETPTRTATHSNNKNVNRIKIDFEDQLVTGKHDVPEAEFIFTRTQFNYKKMIKLRDNFVPEVKQGKDEFRGRN